MEPILITPKTKIYDLLESYPDLEETLIKAAPQFKKLKIPVLRRTIARVTSISQAAVIGGIKVEDLINTLRREAGQQLLDSDPESGPGYNFETPDWFAAEAVSGRIDIADMLNAGEQPVHEVLSALKKLNSGGILEIHAPFIPAPLIDKALGLGYRYWISKVAEDEIFVYFSRIT